VQYQGDAVRSMLVELGLGSHKALGGTGDVKGTENDASEGKKSRGNGKDRGKKTGRAGEAKVRSKYV
jgi:hypothetical protein